METTLNRSGNEKGAHAQTTSRLAIFESVAEDSKGRLTRALHDDLGALLVAAIMDTVWAEKHAGGDPAMLQRLRIIRQALTTAIVLKRQIIEDLCPTLIENVGLIAALRWYHRRNCENSNLKCKATYPERETSFTPIAAKILFRVVEEMLSMVTRQPTAQSMHLSIETVRNEITIRVIHDGDTMTMDRRTEADLTSLWLVEHRVRGLGGSVTIFHPALGGMDLKARVPLQDIISA